MKLCWIGCHEEDRVVGGGGVIDNGGEKDTKGGWWGLMALVFLLKKMEGRERRERLLIAFWKERWGNKFILGGRRLVWLSCWWWGCNRGCYELVKMRMRVLGEGSTCRGEWFRRKKKKGVATTRFRFY